MVFLQILSAPSIRSHQIRGILVFEGQADELRDIRGIVEHRIEYYNVLRAI